MYVYIYILKLDFQINNYVRIERTFYSEKNIFEFVFFFLIISDHADRIVAVLDIYIYIHISFHLTKNERYKSHDFSIFLISSRLGRGIYAQRNLH